MQDQAQIARAFAAWQRAHQQLCDAEEKLAAATQAWQQGRAPRPDALHTQVASLKAEQEWRYDAAAQALRRRHNGGAPLAAA
jgi:hypothetical protein